MENNDKQRASPENSGADAAKNKFNAGGNSSDYDGGQPQDSSPDSEGRIDAKQTKQQKKKHQSFNSGSNDSDYDGGHPEDGKQSSEG